MEKTGQISNAVDHDNISSFFGFSPGRIRFSRILTVLLALFGSSCVQLFFLLPVLSKHFSSKFIFTNLLSNFLFCISVIAAGSVYSLVRKKVSFFESLAISSPVYGILLSTLLVLFTADGNFQSQQVFIFGHLLFWISFMYLLQIHLKDKKSLFGASALALLTAFSIRFVFTRVVYLFMYKIQFFSGLGLDLVNIILASIIFAIISDMVKPELQSYKG